MNFTEDALHFEDESNIHVLTSISKEAMKDLYKNKQFHYFGTVYFEKKTVRTTGTLVAFYITRLTLGFRVLRESRNHEIFFRNSCLPRKNSVGWNFNLFTDL
jgi:hypothetical protein